ncbi:shikimate dehydrogenase family protein [Clostridium hydrogeniformans]|uniref:shikimate dehydrogenase family protein n=1 Tax=Clostridium hydrogeniformans TaxID=349933 RepID=UPI000485BFDA|nr:shikimate dehydrogenase [Clostridium hydrogeniformans]
MRKCGLLGRNIGYSKSPKIHNDYYKIHNIDLEYELFDMEDNKVDEFFNNLEHSNIIGFNVTIPYKEKVLRYLNHLVYPSNIIGAVNTVVIRGNTYLGYNTDYFGFIKSLQVKGIDVKGKTILILGNGGSSKAIFYALKDLGASSIDMAGRNIKKMEREFLLVDNILNISSDFNFYKYDMVINCTPLGNINNPQLPFTIKRIKKDLIIYDLNYKPSKTKLMELGESLGAICVNGEDMLKFQAYEAIDIWCENLK